MQQMLMQAQRMQRELGKAMAALEAKEFTTQKAGIVEIVMTGDKKLVSVKVLIEKPEADDLEMIQDTIVMAVNETIDQINAESEAIQEKITGQKGGLPF